MHRLVLTRFTSKYFPPAFFADKYTRCLGFLCPNSLFLPEPRADAGLKTARCCPLSRSSFLPRVAKAKSSLQLSGWERPPKPRLNHKPRRCLLARRTLIRHNQRHHLQPLKSNLRSLSHSRKRRSPLFPLSPLSLSSQPLQVLRVNQQRMNLLVRPNHRSPIPLNPLKSTQLRMRHRRSKKSHHRLPVQHPNLGQIFSSQRLLQRLQLLAALLRKPTV